MIFRKYFLVLLIVCVFCLYPFVVYASNPTGNPTDWSRLDSLVKNREDDVAEAIGNYDTIKSVMETLNNDWNTKKQKVRGGVEITLTGTIATIISAAVAIPSGGSSLAPTIFAGMVTGKKAIETLLDSVSSQEYVEAMGTTLSLMDQAQLDVQKQYNRYTTQYNDYLQMWVDHGIIHYNVSDREWSSVFTDIETLNTYVNVQDKDDNYYNQGTTSTSAKKHAIRTSRDYRHWDVKPPHGTGNTYWKTFGLPKDYRCEGHSFADNCDFYFRSPHEALFAHGIQCEGCTWIYHTCKNDYSGVNDFHKLRDCNRRLLKQTPNGWEEVDCPNTYRNCDVSIIRFGQLTTFPNPPKNSHAPDGIHLRRIQLRTYNTDCYDIDTWPKKPFPPQNLSLTSLSNSISLSWESPALDGGASITRYEYQYKRGRLGSWSGWTSNNLKTSATISNLLPNKTYYVEVRAKNSVDYSHHTSSNIRTNSPAVFTPSLVLTYNSSTGAVSMTATANQPIYGADLYVLSPEDSSNKYGTKIKWTFGNSNRTTYLLPVSYSFPSTAASGTYKFTLRVYPFNDSGSGDPWGTPYDVFKNVTVQ